MFLLGFLNCLVYDFAIWAWLRPISLRGATRCFFRISREISALAESSEETWLPLELPSEHLSHPI